MPENDTPTATRLIFSYDGDEVRLVSQQRVDVAVPGFDVSRSTPQGHFVEVRDADGAALSRVPVEQAVGRHPEVFGEPGEPIVRVTVDRPSGAFTVVVPAPGNAARAVLIRRERVAAPGGPAPTPGGTDSPGGRERSVELVNVELD